MRKWGTDNPYKIRRVKKCTQQGHRGGLRNGANFSSKWGSRVLPGTINLPGVFAIILRIIWWRSGFWPPFGRELLKNKALSEMHWLQRWFLRWAAYIKSCRTWQCHGLEWPAHSSSWGEIVIIYGILATESFGRVGLEVRQLSTNPWTGLRIWAVGAHLQNYNV
jgi:hypothetical protein